MAKIRDADYTFVTDNGSDFSALYDFSPLYEEEELHAGWKQ